MSCAPGRLHLLATLSVALLAAAPSLARAGAPEPSVPLGVTTPGPFRQLFLDAPLTDARAVSRRTLRLRLESSNSWSVPARFTRGSDTLDIQTDAQADALVLSATLPWSSLGSDTTTTSWQRRVATTIGWRITAFWGGFEDGIIESWHRLVGSTNFSRASYPRNQIHVRMAAPGGGGPIDVPSGRLAPGDVVIGTQALLAAGGTSRVRGAAVDDQAWGVAARLDVKLPTGALPQLGGSGGVDAALSLLGTAEIAPWMVVHGRASASLFSGIAALSPLQPNTLQLAVEASVVLLAGEWALVLEDRYLSPLMDGTGWTVEDGGSADTFVASSYPALFRPHNQITIGVRYGPGTLSVSEDFTPGPNPRGAIGWFYNSNAPDIVVAFTMRLPL